MSYHPKQKLEGRSRRQVRVRKKVFGTTERPRLSVHRSARHIYAQVIDDSRGATLVSASDIAKDLRGEVSGKKAERAQAVGKALAAACRGKDIDAVVFDRSGYRFHGRIKAVADGAREGGLRF